ncbi:EamA family transporter RarD [Arthrobacter sp. NPDC056727]|uniref:EamA family transporter RarD n=1 Tax=Arthrobacter sp. NPDC056727 TaxID=3345927 RepID=UPI00366EAB77
MPTTTRGVLASVSASILFGILFFLPSLLEGLTANQVLAWRTVVTIPAMALLLTLTRSWADVRSVVRRIRESPSKGFVLVACGALIGVQTWLFGWGPQSGQGLDIALGYLMLPLVAVVVGSLLYGERLSVWRASAVVTAAVGVIAAVVLAGGIRWPTLVVSLGFPVYFVLRKRTGLNGAGALFFETIALLPFVIWVLAQPDASRSFGGAPPTLFVAVLLLGVLGAAGLSSYLAASRLLDFALFGLLGYLEPVLLIIVAVMFLGERLTPSDFSIYVPITLALVLLAIEAVHGLHRRASARS